MFIISKENAINLAKHIFDKEGKVSICRLNKDDCHTGLDIRSNFVRPPAYCELIFTTNIWEDILDFIEDSEKLGYIK